MQQAIPIKERLGVTLRFLATSDSYQSLSYIFKFSPQLISTIVPEVCAALNDALKDLIKLPKNTEDWKKIASDFNKFWNFPYCLGAIDGKHVLIQAPHNSGSEFFNYKNTFSIVLMALVDANYNFLFADIGCQGRISDGGVFRNSILFEKINGNDLNLPPIEPLVGRQKSVPYVFVADDAFPLTNKMLKPFPGCSPKGSIKRIFNYRLSRARRIVENTFGIMVSVFRVLCTPLRLQPEKVTTIVMSCALLHNFLRKSKTSKEIYSPPGSFDFEDAGSSSPGSWRANLPNVSLQPLERTARRPTTEAQEIRNEFAQYFVDQGKIMWQEKYS